MIYTVDFFPQSDTKYLDQIVKCGIGINLNPLQIAANFDCPDALVALLQYLCGLCKKDEASSELRAKLVNIIHVRQMVKKTNKSLMQLVLDNRIFFASQNLFLQIENYIHMYDSIPIKRCVLGQMGSGLASKEVIGSVQKMLKKKIGVWTKTKIAVTIFLFLLPLSLSPYGLDVGTDSLLLVEYWTAIANDTSNKLFNTVSQGDFFSSF